jgi:cytochrome b6-f complex iron-sulfur subunit
MVHGCQALTLVGVGSWIEGCGGSPTAPSNVTQLTRVSAPVSAGAVRLDVGATPALAAVGSAALVDTSSGSLLVSRTTTDTFTALTAVCTHEACTVTGFQDQRYVCPCHGSQYTTAGTVTKGPAPKALRQFATSFDGTTLTITL